MRPLQITRFLLGLYVHRIVALFSMIFFFYAALELVKDRVEVHFGPVNSYRATDETSHGGGSFRLMVESETPIDE